MSKKYNITMSRWGHEYDWSTAPSGSELIKERLAGLKKYLTFDKKQSMSKYEVRFYEWILKKQYKADPITIFEWSEKIDTDGWLHRTKIGQQYYLGYYNPTYKSIVYEEDKYAKEQQKNRARFHSKMGR
jgi:hypothetical protein